MFLSNGQLCRVIEQTEKGYYVRPVFFYEGYEDEFEVVGSIALVEKVYEKPPVKAFNETIHILSKEVKSLSEKRDMIIAQMRDINGTIRKLEAKKGEVSRGFVDLSLIKAKDWKIQVLFRNDWFAPRIIDRKKMEVENIQSISTQQRVDRYGKITAWFTLSDSRDSMYNYSHQMDIAWGIKNDPDMNEVLEFAHNKFRAKSDSFLQGTAKNLIPNLKWVPVEYHKQIEEKAASEKAKEQERLQREIESQQRKLDTLKSQQ